MSSALRRAVNAARCQSKERASGRASSRVSERALHRRNREQELQRYMDAELSHFVMRLFASLCAHNTYINRDVGDMLSQS